MPESFSINFNDKIRSTKLQIIKSMLEVCAESNNLR